MSSQQEALPSGRRQVAKPEVWRYHGAMQTGLPFDQLVHFLPNGLVLLDQSGLIQYMNPAAETLTDSTLAEAKGRHWREVFTVKVDDPARDQTGSLMEILLERPILLTKAGRSIPIELEISQLKDDRGESAGSMLVLHDVTDLNTEREGLKESRAKYRRLVNTIEGVVWEADGEGVRMRFVSDFAAKLLGYPPRNWLKDPAFWKSIIHPDDRESVLEIINNAIQQRENFQIEYRVVAADGKVLLVRDSVTLSMENNRIRLSGVMTDITSSKQARDSLVRSEERFSAAFYSNPAALLLLTEYGKILDANESLERMTGFFREELLERSVVDAGLCTEKEYDAMTEKLLDRIQVRDAHFQVRTKAGEQHQVLASFRKIILSGEACLIGVFRDVVPK
ncbi:MAG TPA: PAS domain S-box protein [Acidobacteriota bacterium]|nr:PAS domain S-box protein [Acidobacteriota bacterium]